MKMRLAHAVLAACLASQGCGPLTLASRTLLIEPIHYWVEADSLQEIHRNHKLAEEAWEAITKSETSATYSPDYAGGFKDGFADFLYAGGTGDPPPLPPRYYWKIQYQTPEGHQAIEDWFAGFRHGAVVAQQSGYRQWVTIPSSLPPRIPPDQHSSSISPESPVVTPSEPVLPPPRKVVPPQGPDKESPDGAPKADAVPPSKSDEEDLGTNPATPADPVPPPQ